MSDRYMDLISEYLDGSLDTGTHRQVERHLASCSACAALLADLERVVARARTAAEDDVPPTEDLWPGIEARLRRAAGAAAGLPAIRPLPERRSLKPRVSFTLPQLAAACVALIAISAAGALYVDNMRNQGERSPAAALPTEAATTADASQDAIRDVERLRQVLASRRNELDPATVHALEESLGSIDKAIRQAQLALAADPKNPYLRDHLDDTMRRKVDLMRRATMLASAN